MPKSPKNFSPQEKSQVALAAIKGEKTLAQIGSEFEIHPTQIGMWKKHAITNLPELFKDTSRKKHQEETERQDKLDSLYRIIGQRETELDWMKKKCSLLHSG